MAARPAFTSPEAISARRQAARQRVATIQARRTPPSRDAVLDAFINEGGESVKVVVDSRGRRRTVVTGIGSGVGGSAGVRAINIDQLASETARRQNLTFSRQLKRQGKDFKQRAFESRRQRAGEVLETFQDSRGRTIALFLDQQGNVRAQIVQAGTSASSSTRLALTDTKGNIVLDANKNVVLVSKAQLRRIQGLPISSSASISPQRQRQLQLRALTGTSGQTPRNEAERRFFETQKRQAEVQSIKSTAQKTRISTRAQQRVSELESKSSEAVSLRAGKRTPSIIADTTIRESSRSIKDQFVPQVRASDPDKPVFSAKERIKRTFFEFKPSLSREKGLTLPRLQKRTGEKAVEVAATAGAFGGTGVLFEVGSFLVSGRRSTQEAKTQAKATERTVKKIKTQGISDFAKQKILFKQELKKAKKEQPLGIRAERAATSPVSLALLSGAASKGAGVGRQKAFEKFAPVKVQEFKIVSKEVLRTPKFSTFQTTGAGRAQVGFVKKVDVPVEFAAKTQVKPTSPGKLVSETRLAGRVVGSDQGVLSRSFSKTLVQGKQSVSASVAKTANVKPGLPLKRGKDIVDLQASSEVASGKGFKTFLNFGQSFGVKKSGRLQKPTTSRSVQIVKFLPDQTTPEGAGTVGTIFQRFGKSQVKKVLPTERQVVKSLTPSIRKSAAKTLPKSQFRSVVPASTKSNFEFSFADKEVQRSTTRPQIPSLLRTRTAPPVTQLRPLQIVPSLQEVKFRTALKRRGAAASSSALAVLPKQKTKISEVLIPSSRSAQFFKQATRQKLKTTTPTSIVPKPFGQSFVRLDFPVLPPLGKGGGFDFGFKASSILGPQTKGFKPSLSAAGLGIKAPKVARSLSQRKLLTGFELRPLGATKKRKKRRGVFDIGF